MTQNSNILATEKHTQRKDSCLRRVYHWTLAWANHPQARWALFFIALIEASVFPIPPDVLLLALALGRPDLSLRFAGLATAGSTIGAAIGYGIGMLLLASVGIPILTFFGAMPQFDHVQALFQDYGVALVLIAGFSPIPFKVITIAAGAFGLSFWMFLLAALCSRGARFYLEGAVMRWGGERLRTWVERYFEWLTLLVVVLVVAGFAVLWLFR
ncbi:MAG: YqaA family protein [Mariprofundaceae bacterium]|nr:YqaA family protein [Mariprofundaceae bacterium]